MRFHHISKKDVGSHEDQARFFHSACVKNNIEYIRYTEKETNPLEIPKANRDDIIYRSAASVWGKSMERLLVTESCRHIYTDYKTVIMGKGSSYHHFIRERLPTIPSLSFFPARKRETNMFVEHLGGFPVVIKVYGGMEGVGVMRVDSSESFNSVADFIRKDPKAEFRIMKYIPHKYYGRLVVLGDKVIASTRDIAPVGDFRANARGARKEKGTVYRFSAEVEDIAIRATRSVGVHFAGVDVLIADNGKVFLAEANSPFNFAETQRRSGIDIATLFVESLSK